MTIITEVKAQYKEARAKLADLKAQYIKLMQDSVKETFQEFFVKYPEMTSFQWTQYTPHFNDGDTCYFRCYIDYPLVFFTQDGEEYEFDENGYGDFEPEWFNDFKKDLLAWYDNDKELMEAVFGDHVRVVVTQKGVHVEEYYHD